MSMNEFIDWRSKAKHVGFGVVCELMRGSCLPLRLYISTCVSTCALHGGEGGERKGWATYTRTYRHYRIPGIYIYIYIPGAYARTTPLEGLHQRDCCRVTPPLSLSLSIKQFNTLEHQEEMAHEKHAPRRNWYAVGCFVQVALFPPEICIARSGSQP